MPMDGSGPGGIEANLAGNGNSLMGANGSSLMGSGSISLVSCRVYMFI